MSPENILYAIGMKNKFILIKSILKCTIMMKDYVDKLYQMNFLFYLAKKNIETQLI